MKKSTKLVIAGIVVVAVIGVAASGVASRSNAATQVRIETVGTRDLVAIVSATGWIEPHRKVDVQADLVGRITELRVAEGQMVRRGDILLRIDPTQYEAAAQRARAVVSESSSREAQTRANVLQAQRAYDRLRALAEQDANLVSQQAIEEAETQLAVQRELLTAAGFGVAQARAALGEAEDRLSKTVVRSPMDGIVTRLVVEEGEMAIVSTMDRAGSLLLTVADLSTMTAVVRVDETDMPRLTIGDSATLTIDAFRGQTFTGQVTEISHSSTRSPRQAQQGGGTAQAVDFEVRITLASPPVGLRSDLSTTAEIVTARRNGVLAIPIIALTVREKAPSEALPNEAPAAAAAAADAATSGDQEGVFVVREGKVQFMPVQVGIAGRGYFEAVSGVVEGDSVVAGPYETVRTLTDGKAVRALDTTATATPAGRTGAR
jgi:HlyD family secretion protein